MAKTGELKASHTGRLKPVLARIGLAAPSTSKNDLMAAMFIGDVRTSYLSSSAANCVVLKNREGAAIRYEYDRETGVLMRIKDGVPALSVTGLRSFKLSILDDPQLGVSSVSAARILTLDWSDGAGEGRSPIARLRG